MNNVNIIGRVVKDAELSRIGDKNTPKTSFTLAVERSFQKDKNNKVVDFIPCVLIGRGETLHEYLNKGKKIAVTGELHIDNYEKEGQKRSFTSISVDRLEFLDSSSQKNNESQNNSQANDDFPDIAKFDQVEDDDIPF